MSCIPASHSMNNILTQVEPQLEESPGERRGSRAYQIFPEVNKDEDSCPENILYRRERLPSIVVEPTELEGGSTRWPKLCPSGSSLEEGEETGCSADPTEQDSTAEPEYGSQSASKASKTNNVTSLSQCRENGRESSYQYKRELKEKAFFLNCG
ncbi:protein LBH-like isoform X1 [Takifugu flavidus]|uniref:protein LBH-like isoform X1 n=1 Tax=Takifugu flavidus TaxID=433684 RepID=UPI002544B173|nr:protein LBH-like isoform X1 [Takifugu flavidus]